MLFNFLFRSKPKPKFMLGQIVERFSDHHPGCRYMMIKERHFARLRGQEKKQWVYSGVAIRVTAGRLGGRDEVLAVTKIRYVLETHLEVVDGLEPPGFNQA